MTGYQSKKLITDRTEGEGEMDIVERLREDKKVLSTALRNMLRWHDQLSPADIAKAEAALKESE